MTRAQSGANRSDAPSPSQLLLAALLRLAAMLVSGAACLLWMRPSRLAGECHADVTPAMLPSAGNGNHKKEETPAAANSQIPEALMVSRPHSGRPSNHEGMLTGASHTSRNSANVLLPRAGEATRTRTGERSEPGGGPSHRLTTSPPVPHRIVPASLAKHASLPRSGEENRARLTS